MIESLLHKEESSLIFSAKKLICIGETSVPQTVCLLSEVNKYTAELSPGSSRNASVSRRAQMSTETCIKLFTRRRIKRRDRRRSFSISLNFYQTILELSQQTRFMFDLQKFNIINRCANIYSRLLIVLESCQYLLIPSLQVCLVEMGAYGQKRLLSVLGTSQYFLMPSLWKC